LISASLLLVAALIDWVVPSRARLALWTAIVVAGVVPWDGWTDHSHWGRIQWDPLLRPFRLDDIFLNLVLYCPLGYFITRGRPRRRVWWAVLYGLLLSMATELTQVYSHSRFPSMTDVCTNTIGAWLGALAGQRWWRREDA
jgi:hypothetical protein